MKLPKFSFSDVLAIIGFGFGVTQLIPSLDGRNLPLMLVSSFLLMVIAALLYALWRTRRANKHRFQLINAARGKEGDDFVWHMKNAKKHIRVIHTVPSLPGAKFTLELLEGMERGVEVIRIIPEALTHEPKIKDWLSKFTGNQHYRQHIIPGDKFRMPFSFVIVDDEKVFAYFPDSSSTETSTEVIYINNHDVALMFRNVFLNLYSQAEKFSHENGSRN
jgi:hypothetical protein